jgi:hypothetical protein
VAILKILKTKSTTLSDDLFLCHVSKESAVWSEFNIFCTLVTMCDVVPFRVDFFKMATVAMETAKMLKKNEKHKNDHSRLLTKQKLMKLDRNNIHICCMSYFL